MTKILERYDGFICRIYDRLRTGKKRPFIAGAVIYTVLFAAYFAIALLPHYLATGSLIGGDALIQYYPYTMEFRRDLISFFDSFSSGSPALPLISTDFLYGADLWTSVYPDYIPFLPFYIFLPLVPESAVHVFYGIGTALLTYISGLTFYYMCVYFGKDPLISGFFSPFYVFCCSFFSMEMINQHLLYVAIGFPLLIAGIDKLICKKGFLLFPLTVFWISLWGYINLVYSIPFVVLFALIRVRFVYPEKYLKNLGACFIRCFGAFLLGVALAGFIILPALSDYFTSIRSNEDLSVDMAALLTPSLDYLADYLAPFNRMYLSETGICPAILPLIAFFFFVSDGKKNEVRSYTLVMTVLLSLPILRSGMNGFRYMDVRWGEIPALLLCFLCVDMCCGLGGRLEKKQVIGATVVSAVYIVLASFGWFGIAALWLTLALLFTLLPFSERALSGIAGFFAGIREKLARRPALGKALRLTLICVCGTLLIVYIAYLLRFNKVTPYLIIAGAAVIAAMWVFLLVKKYARAAASLLTVCIIAASCLYLSDNGSINDGIIKLITYSDSLESDILNTYSGIENGDGTFGRIADYSRIATLPTEYYSVSDPDTSDTEEISEDDDSTPLSVNDNDYFTEMVFENKGLLHGKPVIVYFKSLINNDLMAFLHRCGQDCFSLPSKVEVRDMAHKEPLHSLFGVSTFYSDKPISGIYGLEKVRDGYENGDLMFAYHNTYALPVGVTYDTAADKARFDSFGSDVLPYAAMNEMYFEGLEIPEGMKRSSAEYAKKCSIGTEKRLRGTTSLGMTCYDHTVTINDDVSDCFVYITFTGVDEEIRHSLQKQLIIINADRETTYYSVIHNRYSDYNWIFPNDTYTISLGYHENDVDLLEFASPFNYEDFYVSAVPRTVFTDAYDLLTREKLEDPQLSTNTLTGHITVSKEKMLSVNLVYLKGWRAYVDGKQVPIYKANGVFMGAMLEPGTHDIRFEYTSHLLPEGLILSAAALVLLVVIAIIRYKKARTWTI